MKKWCKTLSGNIIDLNTVVFIEKLELIGNVRREFEVFAYFSENHKSGISLGRWNESECNQFMERLFEILNS